MCLFGINLSFFIDSSKIKISNGLSGQIQILSSVSNSSYVTHRQTDCLFFSWLFADIFFFHGERKNPKSVNIAIFGEGIDIIR